MTVTTNYGTDTTAGLVLEPIVVGAAGRAGGIVRCWSDRCELAASEANSIIYMARVPSNARILGYSKVYFDDLASTGSPTLDFGVAPTRAGDFTADVDALNNGADVATAAGSKDLLSNIDKFGKQLWDAAGLSADPKTDMWITASVLDASTNATGTVAWEIYYTLD